MKRSNALSKLNTTVGTYLHLFYRLCYVVGIRTIRCFKSLVRFTQYFWRPVAVFMHRVAETLFARYWREFCKECHRIAEGFRLANDQVHSGVSITAVLRLPLLAARRHRKTLIAVRNVVFPVVAVMLLLFTSMYWGGKNYVLALSYHGEEIGCIAGESTYIKATELICEKVNNVDGTFSLDDTPELRIHFAADQTVLSPQETCDRILEVLDDEVRSLVGVYVDDVFRGCYATTDAVKALKETVLTPYRTAAVHENYDGVDFVQTIETVEGLYPVSALLDESSMTEVFERLTIASYKNLPTYTEIVPFSTTYINDKEQVFNYSKTEQKGVNGKQEVAARAFYIDGKEAYRTVVSTKTIKQAVPCIIRVGTKRYEESTSLGDGVATGTFVWPVPYTKRISSYYANRWGSFHGALDIADTNIEGKPIIASDGGIVIEAQRHPSYGNYLLIDHGNGYKTRYAHCNKLVVKEGDKVAKGQYIATVGKTGNVTGPHLHFEMLLNDKLVDPLKYVPR